MAGEGESNSSGVDDRDLRVLILTPQGRDSALAEKTLARSGLTTHVCQDIEGLRQEITAGAGCVLIAEEALPREGGENAWFGSEPGWSSLPIALLLSRGSSFHNLKLLQLLERARTSAFSKDQSRSGLWSVCFAPPSKRVGCNIPFAMLSKPCRSPIARRTNLWRRLRTSCATARVDS